MARRRATVRLGISPVCSRRRCASTGHKRDRYNGRARRERDLAGCPEQGAGPASAARISCAVANAAIAWSSTRGPGSHGRHARLADARTAGRGARLDGSSEEGLALLRSGGSRARRRAACRSAAVSAIPRRPSTKSATAPSGGGRLNEPPLRGASSRRSSAAIAGVYSSRGLTLRRSFPSQAHKMLADEALYRRLGRLVRSFGQLPDDGSTGTMRRSSRRRLRAPPRSPDT
jgi:hypothetical protein